MSLPRELLEQARHLASLEPDNPRQASLRRAISTAYYSLFHLFVAEGCRRFLPGEELRDVRHKLARAFDHRAMKTVSRAFAGGPNAPKLPPEIVPIGEADDDTRDSLAMVARTFVTLQEKRHEADYDTGLVFDRSDVLTHVESTIQAFRAWGRVRKSPLARAYLIARLVGDRWDRK